jgi:hypothetical protein
MVVMALAVVVEMVEVEMVVEVVVAINIIFLSIGFYGKANFMH